MTYAPMHDMHVPYSHTLAARCRSACQQLSKLTLHTMQILPGAQGCDCGFVCLFVYVAALEALCPIHAQCIGVAAYAAATLALLGLVLQMAGPIVNQTSS